MIDPIAVSIEAIARGDATRLPLVAFAGLVTSLGPCVAPRYIAIAALLGEGRRTLTIATFVAGMLTAYTALAFGTGLLGQLAGHASALYVVLAVALALGGSATLLRGSDCDHTHREVGSRRPEPRRLSGVFSLGAASAFVVSPCCTPVVAAVIGMTAVDADPGFPSGVARCVRARPCRAAVRRRIDRFARYARVSQLECEPGPGGRFGFADAGSRRLLRAARVTRTRRLLLAGSALAVAFALFRGQLAAAVVTRGDDALRIGDTDAAIRFYNRAATLDSGSTIAADRLAFHLALRHDRAGAQQAIVVATRALAAGAPEPALLVDRAFAELQLHIWRAAERDFARAGTLAHDARYEQFAGRMALRSSDRSAARRYALLALADDPKFTPARTLLRTLR